MHVPGDVNKMLEAMLPSVGALWGLCQAIWSARNQRVMFVPYRHWNVQRMIKQNLPMKRELAKVIGLLGTSYMDYSKGNALEIPSRPEEYSQLFCKEVHVMLYQREVNRNMFNQKPDEINKQIQDGL